MREQTAAPGTSSASLRLDRWGRLVLPAAMRRALGLKAGDDVLVRVEDGELRITGHRQALRHAQQLVVERTQPADASLVEDLLAERRSESPADG